MPVRTLMLTPFAQDKDDVTQLQKTNKHGPAAATTPTLVSMCSQVHEGSCPVNYVVSSNRGNIVENEI